MLNVELLIMRQSQYMSANDIKYLVLHCSASRCNEDYSVEQLRRDHKAQLGFMTSATTSTSVRMER